MKTNTDNIFEDFLSIIELTKSQKEDAKTKYTGVCKKLHSFYYPDIEYNGSTKLLFGSYRKKTNIKPPADVDVIFKIQQSVFDKFNSYRSNGQSQLLQEIRNILSEKYTTVDEIKGWGRIVLIKFQDSKHNIELLPGLEQVDGTFLIPNTENGGIWERFNPKENVNNINDSNKRTAGKTKALIKLVKQWKQSCTVGYLSYELELKVVDFYNQSQELNNEYRLDLALFFQFLQRIETETERISHITTALKRLENANSLIDKNKVDDAILEWKKVFGDRFPSFESTQKQLFIGTTLFPVIGNSDHCQPLIWSYDEKFKVTLSAKLFAPDKETFYKDLKSDDSPVPKNKWWIGFKANTNCKEDYELYWQVVNTGTEAESNLRGKIFPDENDEIDDIHWETTEYYGKHWVECFIVRSGICVGRSGRFFVNISNNEKNI